MTDPGVRPGSVRVRMYRAPFLRCVLISCGEGEETWRLLVDCGLEPGADPASTEVVGAVQALVREVGHVNVVLASNVHRSRVSGFAVDGWAGLAPEEVWLPRTELPYDTASELWRARVESRANGLLATLPRGSLLAATIVESCLRDEAAMSMLLDGFSGARWYLSAAGASPDPAALDSTPRPPVFDVGPRKGVRVRLLSPSGVDRETPSSGGGRLAKSVDTPLRPFPAFEVEQRRFITDNLGKAPERQMNLRQLGSVVQSSADQPLYRALALERLLQASSVVLTLECGGTIVLVLGDAEWLGWPAVPADVGSRSVVSRTNILIGVEALPPEWRQKCPNVRVAVLPDADGAEVDGLAVLSLAQTTAGAMIEETDRYTEATC